MGQTVTVHTDPCPQSVPIARLEMAVDKISEALDEFRADQKEMIQVLRQISSQEERITHIEADVKRNERDTDELFTRLRELETKPGTAHENLKRDIFLVLGTGAAWAIAEILIKRVTGV